MARVVDWRCSKCGEIFARDKRVMRLAEETYCRKCRLERALGQISGIGEPRPKLEVQLTSQEPPDYATLADWNFVIFAESEGMILQVRIGRELRDVAYTTAWARAAEEAEKRGWDGDDIQIWVNGEKS